MGLRWYRVYTESEVEPIILYQPYIIISFTLFLLLDRRLGSEDKSKLKSLW